MKKSTILTRRDFLRGTCMLGTGLGLAGLGAGLVPLHGVAAPLARTEQQTRLLMGTIVTLTAVTTDASRAEAAFHAAFTEIERLTNVFDRHNPASAVSHLNSSGFLSGIPGELASVLTASADLVKSTEQAFNPAIAPVLDLYESRLSSGQSLRHDDREYVEALSLADPRAIQITKDAVRLERSGMRLTLDGIAKGYIADAASRVLAQKGLGDHMVNAGGDIRVQGRGADRLPWSIGIQHPENRAGLLTGVRMTSGGIATSGNYEHTYNRSRTRNHLINHRTGRCMESASVTVKAASAMHADGLATALAIMPPQLAVAYVEKHGGAACFIVDRYGRSYASGNWG